MGGDGQPNVSLLNPSTPLDLELSVNCTLIPTQRLSRLRTRHQGRNSHHAITPRSRRTDQRCIRLSNVITAARLCQVCTGVAFPVYSTRPNPYTPVYDLQMSFGFTPDWKTYGPITVRDETCLLTERQQDVLYNTHQVQVKLIDDASWGIWAGSTCTRQCRYALASTSASLPIDISRLLDDAHLLDDVHHVGCRITRPIDEL